MRVIKFEYGFQSQNGIVKKVYELSQIPKIAEICDVWNELPIVYVRQFTGLVDKNGVEIYKGDKCDWDGKKVLISWCNQSASFVMTWKKVFKYDGGFKTNNYRNPLLATYGDDDGKYIHEYLEVIGNIHENKELIK
jgi:uncharacterized phage protein (TIGR01671 family)